ncbi:unnamed protein product, partial [Ectocarpus sp. 12 AP-2014]
DERRIYPNARRYRRKRERGTSTQPPHVSPHYAMRMKNAPLDPVFTLFYLLLPGGRYSQQKINGRHTFWTDLGEVPFRPSVGSHL